MRVLWVILLAACSRGAPSADPPGSAGGETLAFVRGDAVWVATATGARRIGTGTPGEPDLNPSVSPRGDYVAYASGEGGTFHIVVRPTAGGPARAITDGAYVGDDEPTWSPDGASIAFMRGDPRDVRDLCRIPAEGGDVEALLAGDDEDPTVGGAPAWSRDGASIALAADRREPDGTRIFVLTLEGRRLAALTPPAPEKIDGHPAWSPDGTTVVFSSDRGGDARQLFAIGSDGSGLRQLTRDPVGVEAPVFGSRTDIVYFTRGPRIYRMPLAGGAATPVTPE